jgi:hypothetical protein
MDAANFKVGSYYESLVLLNSPMLETLIKIYNRQPTEDKHHGDHPERAPIVSVLAKYFGR